MFYKHKNSKLNLFSYISKEANFMVLHGATSRGQRGAEAPKCNNQEEAEARRHGAGLVEHELVARKIGMVGLLVGYGRLWAGGVWT